MTSTRFEDLFAQLREVMLRHCDGFEIVRDAPGDLYVDTGLVRADGYRLMFGAVAVKARYVSYHLMPLYACPGLADDLDPALAARKHGKSCLNLTRADDVLLAGLDDLTAAGAERIRREGVAGFA